MSAEVPAVGPSLSQVEMAMLQAARLNPRAESLILSRVLRDLDEHPDDAEGAYYTLTFRRGDREVVVEGPSIRAAMALARRWGNCRIAARFSHEDDDALYVEGLFWDLESNTVCVRPVRVPKWQRRHGQIIRLPEDDFARAAQAAASKAIRNAILAMLPSSLVSSYVARAKAHVARRADSDQQASHKIIAAFGQLGVSEDQLEREWGPRSGWTPEIIAAMRGVWTAIRDGQMKPEDVGHRGVEEPASVSLSGEVQVENQ